MSTTRYRSRHIMAMTFRFFASFRDLMDGSLERRWICNVDSFRCQLPGPLGPNKENLPW